MRRIAICAGGRRYPFRRESTSRNKLGLLETTAYYRCADYTGCSLRTACCRVKWDTAKQLVVKPDFWEKRKVSEENITTECGMLLRVTRSIQFYQSHFETAASASAFRSKLGWTI
ncbi:MAG: transposase [Oscillospiraceae bacterium]|nr:transposase [Oscillospiraceae bacterium]